VNVQINLSLISSSTCDYYQLRIDYAHDTYKCHTYYPNSMLVISPLESLFKIENLLKSPEQIITIVHDALHKYYLSNTSYATQKNHIILINHLLEKPQLQNLEFDFKSVIYDRREK
jgi:hypothetical protein